MSRKIRKMVDRCEFVWTFSVILEFIKGLYDCLKARGVFVDPGVIIEMMRRDKVQMEGLADQFVRAAAMCIVNVGNRTMAPDSSGDFANVPGQCVRLHTRGVYEGVTKYRISDIEAPPTWFLERHQEIFSDAFINLRNLIGLIGDLNGRTLSLHDGKALAEVVYFLPVGWEGKRILLWRNAVVKRDDSDQIIVPYISFSVDEVTKERTMVRGDMVIDASTRKEDLPPILLIPLEEP